MATNPVVGGNSDTGTVTLDAPAPTGGATVTLTAMNGTLSVPTSVTIPAGQTSATYTITTQTTTTPYAGAIIASYNGIRETTLTVTGSGGCNPPTAPLNLTATAGSSQVTLQWSPPTSGPASYTVYRSLTHGGPYTQIASNLLATQYIDNNVTNGTTYYYVVTAVNVCGESGYSNEAIATPTASTNVYSLSLNPTSVIGGQYSIGTVTLSSPAPSGGQPVTLSSSLTSAATVPSSITVPQGATSAQFAVTTYAVGSDKSVTITATAGSNQKMATLTVQAPSPLTVAGVTFTPNPVTGGGSSTGTVTLNGSAPSGGATLSLSSGNTSVATIASPGTVTIAQGATTGTFTVNTVSVNTSTLVQITPTATTNCKGSASANLTVNPSSINVYISNLTVSPTGVVGTGTSTGTVTLSGAAPTGGAMVLLNSNNSSVTVPASVTVLAGSQQATFPITDNGVTDVSYVTISGAYNTWTQAAILTAMPTGYNLGVQNLVATAGNDCVSLEWQDLPAGSVQGYNVYRLIGSNWTPLNLSLLPSSVYADTTVSNGTTYQYRVTVVNLQGQESTPVTTSATPSSADIALSWSNLPTNPVSGSISFYGSLSSGNGLTGYLLVDGQIMGGLTTTDSHDIYPNLVKANLDTTHLANGNHSVQMVAYQSNVACVTPVYSLQTSNSFHAFSWGSLVETSTGAMGLYSFILPTGTVQWTASILDSNNNVIRSWQAATVTGQLAWDGSDAAGNPVADGLYIFQVSAQDASHHLTQVEQDTNKITRDPTALSLISYPYPNSSNDVHWTFTMARDINSDFKYIHGMYPWWNGLVLLHDPDVPSNAGNTIKRWLKGSVNIFHLYTHGGVIWNLGPDSGGVAKVADFDDISFFPTHSFTGLGVDRQDNTIVLEDYGINNGKVFQFSLLDFCDSIGGSTNAAHPSDPGTPDPTWVYALGVGQTDSLDDNGTVWGWNGDADRDSAQDDNSTKASSWYYWRRAFWGDMVTYLDNVSYAAYDATREAQLDIGVFQLPYDIIFPWDGPPSYGAWRAQMFGDPLNVPFP